MKLSTDYFDVPDSELSKMFNVVGEMAKTITFHSPSLIAKNKHFADLLEQYLPDYKVGVSAPRILEIHIVGPKGMARIHLRLDD